MAKNWRLLEYSSTDPKMNLAINEALFRTRRECLAQDTLWLWRSSRSLVLGSPCSYKDHVNYEACREHGVEVVRALSASLDVFYQDEGDLNFTVVTDATFLKYLTKDYKPVLSEYQILNEGMAKGLRRFSDNVRADSSGIYINSKRISETMPKWFYEFLLFQGTIHINTNFDIYDGVIRTAWHPIKKCMLASLGSRQCADISMDEIKKALVQGIEEALNISFEDQGLTEKERKLAEKLYRVKYSLEKWNIDAREPFLTGIGKTTVEVFVAYPPTSKCREFIRLVDEAVSGLQDEVKVMIWMRGKGLYQHGARPEFSTALHDAEKLSIIPVIIINGELKFRESPPPKEELRKALLTALQF